MIQIYRDWPAPDLKCGACGTGYAVQWESDTHQPEPGTHECWCQECGASMVLEVTITQKQLK